MVPSMGKSVAFSTLTKLITDYQQYRIIEGQIILN